MQSRRHKAYLHQELVDPFAYTTLATVYGFQQRDTDRVWSNVCLWHKCDVPTNGSFVWLSADCGRCRFKSLPTARLRVRVIIERLYGAGVLPASRAAISVAMLSAVKRNGSSDRCAYRWVELAVL